jgi:hypothetical protein
VGAIVDVVLVIDGEDTRCRVYLSQQYEKDERVKLPIVQTDKLCF